MSQSYAALNDILSLAGQGPASQEQVQITGSDRVLASNFLIGTAGAAVISATGLAAANLWELRTGRRQNVAIDVRRAAMAMRSDRFLYRDGKKMHAADPVSGIYQCRDGRWVQLHCNYPHHRARTLALLGAESTKAAVAAAVAKWDGLALETAVTEADSIAGMVRSPAEWAAHPQSAAIDGLPLFDITRIGDSAPEPFAAGARPLAGIRVVDVTRVIAGPMCGRTLAEHGADVMRISGPDLAFNEALVVDTGYGKYAAEIDIASDSGKEVMRRLVGNSDVFSQGYRPGTIAGRGFSPEVLAELRPGIVCLSLCAFSHAGPWRAKRGFDSIVQCCSGIVHEQSEGGDGTPQHLPAQVLDYVTGYLGAYGVMEALRRRAVDGGSYHVRVSLAQTAHWIKRLGRVGAAANARSLPDPSLDDVMDLTMETQSAFGTIRHLAPAVTLSETPSFWARPPVPLTTHQPVWPD
ncbi:MAG: CoA transferase [Proteobacteria bacterium]|nr:CoA transferase [Pseudomonadota bacterium]